MEIQQLQEAFINNQNHRNAYQHAMTILSYDAETVMPRAAGARYSEVMGTLSGESYHLLVNDELKALIKEILQRENEIPRWMFREAQELERSIKKAEVIPQEEYIAFQTAIALSGQAWLDAKQSNNYQLFAPHLQKMLDYSTYFTKLYDSSQPIYNLLLDDYETGLTMDTLDKLFQDIRENIMPLIRQISSAKQPDVRFLQADFPLEGQRELALYVMDLLQIDRTCCAIGESEHPFTTSTNNHDVRITTHYYTNDLLSSLFSVIHEGGHALYMLYTGDELNGSSLAEGSSCSIHESISRFFENYIGRSREFTTCILTKAQEIFPQQLANVTADQFYRACNISRPSLIRTEADELTYPLHIMIRYELEKRLVDHSLSVADLPAEWNRLYKEYLGLDVPDDTHGVLQDMHWSDASFGYFPTYALGSAYSAQILAAMEKELSVWELLAKHDLSPIVNWLKEKLFVFGGIKKPQELLQEISGEAFNPQYYTNYLNKKYRSLYNL